MLLISLFLLLFFSNKNIVADEIQFADGHGPITIMNDHMHKKDELMFSLRYSKMFMNGMLSGTKKDFDKHNYVCTKWCIRWVG